MFTTKFRAAALLILTAILLVAWGKSIPRDARGDAALAPAAFKAPKELLEKRLAEAKVLWDMHYQMFTRGGPRAMIFRELFASSERLLEAELALLDNKEDRGKARHAHVDRTREVERIAITVAKMGAFWASDVHLATYERLNAEIHYFEATGKAPSPPPEAKKENAGESSPAKEKKPKG